MTTAVEAQDNWTQKQRLINRNVTWYGLFSGEGQSSCFFFSFLAVAQSWVVEPYHCMCFVLNVRDSCIADSRQEVVWSPNGYGFPADDSGLCCLRCVPSSTASTMKSWARIPRRAWMFVCGFFFFQCLCCRI
jgi:hypothetical protein